MLQGDLSGPCVPPPLYNSSSCQCQGSNLVAPDSLLGDSHLALFKGVTLNELIPGKSEVNAQSDIFISSSTHIGSMTA